MYNENITTIHRNYENTIRDPDIVCKSAEYANRDVYFSRSAGAPYEKYGLGTKVIVEQPVSNIAVADVITAFAAKGIGGNVDDKRVLYKKTNTD